jgi:simple sugar transport system permease protein
MTTGGAVARPDERVRRIGRAQALLHRPEFGAVLGAIAVWLLFAFWAGERGFLTVAGTANYLQIAAQLGVIGAPVALLIISGEFDLSLGSMIGATGMILAIAISQYEAPVWLAVSLAFAFALGYGFLNGFLVVKTGLPSFIITLASLFILRGLALALSRLLTGSTVVGGLAQHTADDPVAAIFTTKVSGFDIIIVWWILIAVTCHWTLMHTRFGNWIFGTGGSAVAARNMGVPTDRVKITLFMATAASACLLACTQVLSIGSADANRGVLKEFEAIITAVIGGTLLSGGYGSIVGTIFGALTLAITQQGLFFAAVDSEWYRITLGVILLIAVLMNQYARRRAGVDRRG